MLFAFVALPRLFCNMFTGIIEAQGIVENIVTTASNKTFYISSAISTELKVDQSVSHNGVCLTVEAVSGNTHKVTAIFETLQKTNLSDVSIGDSLNLERCLLLNARLDGHLVQGHVDGTATCISITEREGSTEYSFSYHPEFARLVIEKGSICLNGISLTVFDVTQNSFTVAVIPYTFTNTNIQHLRIGEKVNIEFDVIGKYISRIAQLSTT